MHNKKHIALEDGTNNECDGDNKHRGKLKFGVLKCPLPPVLTRTNVGKRIYVKVNYDFCFVTKFIPISYK